MSISSYGSTVVSGAPNHDNGVGLVRVYKTKLPYYGDSDGDGINDIIDNCDDIVNPNQEDYDYDGYGDICDDNKFVKGLIILSGKILKVNT